MQQHPYTCLTHPTPDTDSPETGDDGDTITADTLFDAVFNTDDQPDEDPDHVTVGENMTGEELVAFFDSVGSTPPDTATLDWDDAYFTDAKNPRPESGPEL